MGADGEFERVNEDFAVADLAGAGGGGDGVNDFVDDLGGRPRLRFSVWAGS